MAKKEKTAIVNIGRTGIRLCADGMTNPIGVDYGTDIVADLVVVNQAKLEELVTGFVQQSGVLPGPVVMVLAPDVCFEVDIEPEKTTGVSINKALQRFVDTVPMVSVSSKVFDTPKGQHIVAIGRDFYESFRLALEKAGFRVQIVLASYALTLIGVKTEFNNEACQLIMKHLDEVSGYGFELEEKKEETFSAQRTKFLNAHKLWVVMFVVVALWVLLLVAFMVLRKPGA